MAIPGTYTSGVVARCNVDLAVKQGSDMYYAFRYYDYVLDDDGQIVVVDGVKQKTPKDLSDYTARSQMRNEAGGEVWATFTLGDGITLGADGLIEIFLSHTETESVEWNRRDLGAWDLELIDPDGHVDPFGKGKVFVDHDVTRDV